MIYTQTKVSRSGPLCSGDASKAGLGEHTSVLWLNLGAPVMLRLSPSNSVLLMRDQDKLFKSFLV